MQKLFILISFFAINLNAQHRHIQTGNNSINSVASDAGVVAILSPSVNVCYSASQQVMVTIQNFGVGVLTNIPVNVIVTGPINQSITANFLGSLSAGATTNFVVGNVNMSFGGVYTFSAYTTFPGDANPSNDYIVTSRTVTPLLNLISPNVVCIGNSATLSVTGANSYTWSTGSNSVNITVTPTVTTTYSVIGTNTAGCTSVALKTISVQDPTIATTGTSACGNPAFGSLTATAFSPAVVSWYATPTSTTVLGTGNSYTLSTGVTTTVYAEAHSITSGSLFTTLAGGNSAAGNMFDVTATNALTLTGLDWHFNSNTTSTVEVWYRPGSFVGFENSNSGWTLAFTGTVTPFGTGSLSPVPGTFSIGVTPGQTVGIYVTVTNGSGVNYTNGTGLGNLFTTTADLQLYEGKGGNYFSVTSSPRIFNGRLKYAKADCSSPRVPAVFSTISGVTVTALASYSSVCAGKSATLNGNGATNYTWSPAISISPNPNTATVVASPTVNTTYTLQGAIPGCPNISTYTLNLSITPSPTLTITPSQTVTAGTVVNLGGSGGSTYLWSPGGSNNNNILVSPTVTTVYTLTGTNNYSCTSSITTTITIGSVGLNELSINDENVLLFPNPNNGIITITSEDDHTNYLFEIFDLDGKQVYKSNLSKRENTLDIKNISNGIYTYKISSLPEKATVKQGKLLKQ